MPIVCQGGSRDFYLELIGGRKIENKSDEEMLVMFSVLLTFALQTCLYKTEKKVQ